MIYRAMKKYRDAETGEYITKKEAESRDPATWIAETVEDKTKELQALYDDIMQYCENIGFVEHVKVVLLQHVFRKHGLKI